MNVADSAVTAAVVHHVPGRLRLRIHAGAGAAVFNQVAHMLSRVDGVRAVRVNPAASSIVLHYLPDDGEFVRRIRQQPGLSWGPECDASVPAEAPPFRPRDYDAVPAPMPSRSHVARAIVSTSARLDSSVRRASAGYVDLKLLLPLVFAAVGSVMLRSSRGTPMWMTLAVSAFNSFLTLHPAGMPEGARVPAA